MDAAPSGPGSTPSAGVGLADFGAADGGITAATRTVPPFRLGSGPFTVAAVNVTDQVPAGRVVVADQVPLAAVPAIRDRLMALPPTEALTDVAALPASDT